jgi:hypothetical protein
MPRLPSGVHDLNYRVNGSGEPPQINNNVPMPGGRGLDYGWRSRIVPAIVTVSLAQLEALEIGIVHHENVRSAAFEINSNHIAWPNRDCVMKEIHDRP